MLLVSGDISGYLNHSARAPKIVLVLSRDLEGEKMWVLTVSWNKSNTNIQTKPTDNSFTIGVASLTKWNLLM